jgi:hypothetical protein
MKTSPKTVVPLALVLLLATGGLSACTAEEEPAPIPSTTDVAPSQTVDPNEPGALLTLITNVGTREAPVGASKAAGSDDSIPGIFFHDKRVIARGDSIIFQSYDIDLPGGNGNMQIYRWTPEFGITLITNIGTDGATPVGADGYSAFADANDDGSAVVFLSNATNLPNGNGKAQIYLWTDSDGLALVYDTQMTELYLQKSQRPPFWPYTPTINSDGSVEFDLEVCRWEDERQICDYSIYRWTANEGMLPAIVHSGLSYFVDPGKDVMRDIFKATDGSIVFCSSDPNLPGSNGVGQLYHRTAAGEVALITNVGTAEAPRGAPEECRGGLGVWADSDGFVSSDNSVWFGSDVAGLPGSNGQYQLYRWSLQDGLALISNAGTVEAPVGANSSSSVCYEVACLNASGPTTFFSSNATNLPGGNGDTQIYRWTPADGLSLVTNAGTVAAPVGATGTEWYTTLYKGLHSNGALVSLTAAELAEQFGGTAPPSACPDAQQLYVWTAAGGLTLVTNIGTSQAPVGSCRSDNSSPYFWSTSGIGILSDGSVVFTSPATDLPGSNGNLQIYRWAPSR